MSGSLSGNADQAQPRNSPIHVGTLLGVRAATQTVRNNFGVPVQYSDVILMIGLVSTVAALGKPLTPMSWASLPRFILALVQATDPNIPPWQWPRLLFVLLRPALIGIDSRTTTCVMVTPCQTSQGAQVLAPNWEAIHPHLREMFGP